MIGHLRANAVAYLALFIALGGVGAWAADRIGPKEIKPRAVRAKHIKPKAVRARHIKPDAVRAIQIGQGQVGPGELAANAVGFSHANLVASDKADGEIETNFLDGPPEVVLTPPPDSLLAVFAAVTGRKVTNGFAQPCQVLLLEDPEPFEVLSGGETILEFSGTSFSTRVTTPADANGVAGRHGSWIVFAPEEPGVRTRFSLRYVHNVGDTCAFRERGLWLLVLR